MEETYGLEGEVSGHLLVKNSSLIKSMAQTTLLTPLVFLNSKSPFVMSLTTWDTKLWWGYSVDKHGIHCLSQAKLCRSKC